MKIAELAKGSFDAAHGFIGYDIQLDAGTVDIDLTGSAAGQSIDTIMYLFGPKRANGHYPSTVLAFNDDVEPGINVGSHIVVDVPAAGAYRIVVATYDNYVSFPVHVSAGDYKLIVKCQDPAFGACGPAVSEVGGSCWADEDCLASDGAPLHCEGEITCAPGTQCLWVRMGTCVADYAWMTYSPVQCTNPWSDTRVSDEEAARFPVSELAQVVKYYAGFEITFDEIGVLTKPEPTIVFLACGCSRGDEIAIKVDTPTAAELAGHGWIYSSSDPPAQSLAPAQCGSNPWQTAPAADITAELELVDGWLEGEGASVTKRGFAWPVAPRAVCEACSCPRGDRLVAFGTDAAAHGLLSSLGFADIYVP